MILVTSKYYISDILCVSLNERIYLNTRLEKIEVGTSFTISYIVECGEPSGPWSIFIELPTESRFLFLWHGGCSYVQWNLVLVNIGSEPGSEVGEVILGEKDEWKWEDSVLVGIIGNIFEIDYVDDAYPDDSARDVSSGSFGFVDGVFSLNVNYAEHKLCWLVNLSVYRERSDAEVLSSVTISKGLRRIPWFHVHNILVATEI
ncbi:hypothetical protein K501DRAFT_270289 [Backusella circina FSU 941]|nr:hypothetical protein K501DRAFT_270289 [Backusella circina FSU 941]